MKISYPIKFQPILKEKIWGGEKLAKILNKQSENINIGESWEISDVKEDISIVVNGELKGQSLQELIKTYRAGLVGENVYKNFGDNFPLLIKFIDAKEALSIQVHPNDDLAKERHNSFGKTEMWYVIQADKDAELIVGFQKKSNKEEYINHLNDKTLLDILNVDKVKTGDAYFIPSGRIHAIGAGVMLAEIQQTSDVTYRIYDWDRVDDNGIGRELHTDLALDAIEYKSQPSYKTDYSVVKNKATNIVDCNYFTTNILAIEKNVFIDNSKKDSFVIYMCVKGKVTFIYDNDKRVKLKKGETVLIPASLNKLSIETVEYSELLEVYIKKSI
jgi:mannose-6-phosphate isomerase|tara:strand:+ start:726 stop:1715 length:990 start_codon:yes stop_codon:yes gene_type:complete